MLGQDWCKLFRFGGLQLKNLFIVKEQFYRSKMRIFLQQITVWIPLWISFFRYSRETNLLNMVPRVHRVPKCLSVWVPLYPSALQLPKCQSAWLPKFPSELSARMLKFPSSAQVPKCLEYPSVLEVPKCLSALEVPYRKSVLLVPNIPMTALWVKKVWNIIRIGLINHCVKSFQIRRFF